MPKHKKVPNLSVQHRPANKRLSQMTLSELTPKENALAAARMSRIKIPSVRKYQLTLFLLPSFIVAILFIPIFRESVLDNRQMTETIAIRMEQLEEMMQDDFMVTLKDDISVDRIFAPEMLINSVKHRMFFSRLSALSSSILQLILSMLSSSSKVTSRTRFAASSFP